MTVSIELNISHKKTAGRCILRCVLKQSLSKKAMRFALHSTQTCLLTSCIIPWTIWHVTTESQRKTIAKYTLKKQKKNLTTNWNETIYQGNKIHFVMLHLQKNAMKYVRLSIALPVGVGQICAQIYVFHSQRWKIVCFKR